MANAPRVTYGQGIARHQRCSAVLGRQRGLGGSPHERLPFPQRLHQERKAHHYRPAGVTPTRALHQDKNQYAGSRLNGLV
ncbi:MAG: hypothetical protein F6K55_41790 [Moorea sp. SIO4A3]|nr:hypothetical protein [Moorena sp. SIO4A3]